MSDRDIDLEFRMERQKADFWCWAATARSVSRFHIPPRPQFTWTQCKVAEAVFPEDAPCCPNPRNGPCDFTAGVGFALQKTGNLAGFQRGSVSWEKIKTEVSAGNVVAASMILGDGAGHAVIISGVAGRIGSNEQVLIDDPKYGERLIPFVEFRDNYRGGGSWKDTYFTKKLDNPT